MVPRLRFPEFVGHPMQDVRLADATSESTERNGAGQATLQVMGVSKVEGIVPMEERIVAADTARYKLVRKDWFAYNPMRLNIGSIARWRGHDEILVSPDYVVFKCKGAGPHRLDPAYLDHFRRSHAWEDFVSEKGDGSVRVRIYYKDLARLQLALPHFPEQQKIAECLDSADALIAAQRRKVEALKAHKKGLMQRLFPRPERVENGIKIPAETQPRLRFPEFQTEAEWKEDLLGRIAKFFKGKGISKADIQTDGKRPCIRYGELYTRYNEVIDEVYSKTNVEESDLFLSKRNDVIIPASGETKTDIAKASCVMRDDIALGGDLNVIRTGQNGVFLSYFLNGPKRPEIAKVAQGDTVVHLYPSQLEKLRVRLPSLPEQQRIADCLTSLDKFIAAEARKLETLKVHKNALMQQLFPQVGEADA
ncbi:MAG: restriction endonuclease subunit S [Rhizobiaceae bacterium]|nr:restriction endonuclease subunit S [Rhizobiaceae bacterium]